LVVTIADPAQVATDFAELWVGTSATAVKQVALSSHSLPLAITVTRVTAGEAELWVEARDAMGEPLGRARTQGRFARSGSPSATATLEKACASDAQCVDSSFCNGAERCVEGVCLDGDAACRTSFPCIVSTCVEQGQGLGTCAEAVDHTLCAPGNYCNPVAGCVPGQGCQIDADCDDGSVCNGVERCLGLVCGRGTPPDVADADLCTVDGCSDDVGGAVHVADPSLDGNVCTLIGTGREICVAAAGGCVLSRCGDGFIDTSATPAELCDDGAQNTDTWANLRYCNTACSGWAGYCGDGVVAAEEDCDDGNAIADGNDCSASCTWAGVAAGTDGWSGLGNSDFGPWTTRMVGSSLSYYGIWVPYYGDISTLAAAMAPDGTRYVAVSARIDWDFEEVFVLVAAVNGSYRPLESSGAAGISATHSPSESPAIAIGADGYPVVAWVDMSTAYYNYVVFVRRYDGQAWQEVGVNSARATGITGAVGDSSLPTLVIDSLGRPVVAWEWHQGSRQNICVKAFDGTAWVELGAGSASSYCLNGSTSKGTKPALAVAPGGVIYAAWRDAGSGIPQVYAKKWDGAAWGPLDVSSASSGGVSSASLGIDALALAADSLGNPVIAWNDRGPGPTPESGSVKFLVSGPLSPTGQREQESDNPRRPDEAGSQSS